jgi:predicted phage gp36 major capsid-like protein
MGVVFNGKMPSSHEMELAMRREQEREFEALKRHLIRQREQNSKSENSKSESSKSESSSLTTAAVVIYAIGSGGGSGRQDVSCDSQQSDSGSDSGS